MRSFILVHSILGFLGTPARTTDETPLNVLKYFLLWLKANFLAFAENVVQ